MPGGSVQRKRELQSASVYAFLFTLKQSPDVESAGSIGLSRTVTDPMVTQHITCLLAQRWPKHQLIHELQGRSFVDIKEYFWDGQSELQGNKTPQIRSNLTRRKKAINEIKGSPVSIKNHRLHHLHGLIWYPGKGMSFK